jgi:hypothetical protein
MEWNPQSRRETGCEGKLFRGLRAKAVVHAVGNHRVTDAAA